MSDAGSSPKYDLTEIFVIKFVLADIVIIAALLFAGPLYAIAITALLVLSVLLVWYLMERAGGESSEERDTESDPVTRLQERYAAGELTESEFEAKLDHLLDANERAERSGVETKELSLDRAN
ncbi:MAG: SHOCT domain-containing protein [Euryarchaeota archaeon]|jgi:uncharacterized membrane protein|nr:SHOCT domain-containing protein [Euryarchaeota archaeon]